MQVQLAVDHDRIDPKVSSGFNPIDANVRHVTSKPFLWNVNARQIQLPSFHLFSPFCLPPLYYYYDYFCLTFCLNLCFIYFNFLSASWIFLSILRLHSSSSSLSSSSSSSYYSCQFVRSLFDVRHANSHQITISFAVCGGETAVAILPNQTVSKCENKIVTAFSFCVKLIRSWFMLFGCRNGANTLAHFSS